MNKKVFVINGSGGVGKDTFATFVSEYAKTLVISSVDPIKNLMRIMGWNGEKSERDRKFMSDLKDLCTNYNDYPMEYLTKEYESFMEDDELEVLFMHIREPHEIEKAVENFGAETILVTNKNVEQIVSNHADANVYNYTYDYVIENDGGLEDLKEAVKIFCIVAKVFK